MCRRVALFVLTLFMASGALAKPVMAYFEASVPVKSQQESERRRAAGEALLQVLLRMSGDESTPQNPKVLEEASQAVKYVEQFQYRPLDVTALTSQGYTQRLVLSFSPVVVEKILNEAQLPFWSHKNRPSTLVWLVEDHPEFGKQLLNQHSGAPILDVLEEAAAVRGLPLQYPLLDLDDQLALSAENVWDFDEVSIAEASERYDADAVLVGRFSTTSSGELWAIWQYYHAGSSQSYDSRTVLMEEGAIALQTGVDAIYPLADFLSSRYAIQPQLEAGGLLVAELSGVNNFSHYRRSLDYLEGLAAVSKVHIAAVRQDTMLVYIESEASVDRFVSVLELDNKLHLQSDDLSAIPAWQQTPRGTQENPLRFKWAI